MSSPIGSPALARPEPGPGSSDVALVAIALPRPAAAAAVTRAWNAGEAVTVLDPAAPPRVRSLALELLRPTHLVDPEGRHDVPDGVGAPVGTAAVVTTSGTTAAPKGVELTTAGLEAIGAGFAAAFGTPSTDRWLVCLPLDHVAGLAILARARVSGAAIVVHPAFDVDTVASSPAAEQTTLVSVVPTMMHRLLEAHAPLSAFRHIITGGAPLPPALRSRAHSASAVVTDAYGLSETWGGVMLDGVPIPGADVMLADDGEVLVRGPMVMRGYRFLPGATAAAFTSDGWLRTGDVGARARSRVQRR